MKFILFPILFFLLPVAAHASTQSAQEAYERGDFEMAADEYGAEAKRKSASRNLYNLGAALYKGEKFAEAEKSFQQALATDNLELQQDTYYNLGNAQYRAGQKTEQTNPQQTIAKWKESIQSYEAALQLDPEDEDAKFNLELVKKKLEQLQKQQEQQQQNQQNQDQQNQNQQNQQQQSGQDQSDSQNNQKNQQGQQPQQDKEGKQGKDQQKQPQQGDQEKDQAGSDQKKDQPGQPKPQKPEGSGQQKPPPSSQPQEPERQPGQMSRSEAESLLDALKDEQVDPSQMRQGNVGTGREDEVKRNW